MYTIPGPGEWTIIVHKNTEMRSIAGGRVKAENDAFRFTVSPLYNPLKVETFTMQFTDIHTYGLHVQLSWENTIVRFPITVEVDERINAQMAELLQDPASVEDRALFRAAEFYLHNKRNYDQAMEWIDLALEKSEHNYRYGLLKAKIYEARGQMDLAKQTVRMAHDWASAADNANYQEQTATYLASLEGNDDSAAGTTEAYADDVSSLDNILTVLYDVISGEAGEARDWARFQHLFVPEAKLIPSRVLADGKMTYRVMSPAEYVNSSGSWLEKNGFFEVEIHREVEEYGSLVHAFSTYESYRSAADEEPFAEASIAFN